jgi:hypothetical protein
MVADVNLLTVNAVDKKNTVLTTTTALRCLVTFDILCLEPQQAKARRRKTVTVETNTGVKVGS